MMPLTMIMMMMTDDDAAADYDDDEDDDLFQQFEKTAKVNEALRKLLTFCLRASEILMGSHESL